MARLMDYYKKDVAPALMKKFNYKSATKFVIRLVPGNRALML